MNRIPASKDPNRARAIKSNADADEARDDQKKRKLNIFDPSDETNMKQETLQRLGHDEKALMPVDENADEKLSISSS